MNIFQGEEEPPPVTLEDPLAYWYYLGLQSLIVGMILLALLLSHTQYRPVLLFVPLLIPMAYYNYRSFRSEEQYFMAQMRLVLKKNRQR